MKSVFDSSVRQELINRINSLSEQNKAAWGKMNVFQMIKHCTLCEEMLLRKIVIKKSIRWTPDWENVIKESAQR